MRINVVFLIAVFLLAACSTPRLAEHPSGEVNARSVLKGRISVKQGNKNSSSAVQWTHLERSDEILLLAPFGQTVARIYSDARRATLDSGGKHYQADNVEALMQQVLGWHLPLKGLHHWVLGMPSDQSPADIRRDENGRISQLNQDDWQVRYLRYAERLPSRLQLSHEDMQVQLLIDEWDWNQQ